MTIREVLHTTLLPKLDGVRNVGGYFMARCPAHEDREASLSIKPGDTQPIILMCHAGCQTEDILSALDLTWRDISLPEEERPTDEEWTPAGPASAVYDYSDEHGALLFQVLRVPQPGGGKTFRQRRPDPLAKTGWKWKLGDVKRVLYRLPQLIAALENGETVWICEGEKDVHALVTLGFAATCNSGGAGKWLDEYTDHFVDAHVRIIADCDTPGQAHARTIADSIVEIAGSVTILEPVIGKDISEHLSKGKTLDELVVTWKSERDPITVLAQDLHEFLAVEDPATSWVVPGLIERGDRLVWTGYEGLGKALRFGKSPSRWRQAVTPLKMSSSPVNVSSTSTARTPSDRAASTSAGLSTSRV